MTRRERIRATEIELALDAVKDAPEYQRRIGRTVQALSRGGPRQADSPDRVMAFVAREMRRSRALARRPNVAGADVGFERRFGDTLDYEQVPPSQVAQQAGGPVARLIDLPSPGIEPFGFATGFMISDDLLLTNWHVFGVAAEAQGTAAQFGYELVGGQLRTGLTCRLEPERFFVSNRALDFALIAVERSTASGGTRPGLRFLPLIPTIGKILKGHPVHMIQHPGGQPKTYVSRNNQLVDLDATYLRYLSDTDEGSSGSPSFNPAWELVALHHRSVPRVENGHVVHRLGGVWQKGMSPDDIVWLANEGIRISVIVEALRSLSLSSPAQQRLLDAAVAQAVDPVDDEGRGRSDPQGDAASPAYPISTTHPASPGGIPRAGAEERKNGHGMVYITVNGSASFTIAGGGDTATATDASSPYAPSKDAHTYAGNGTPPPGLEAVIRFDPKYAQRAGYQRKDFLGPGIDVPPPRTGKKRMGEMLLAPGTSQELVLPYHHYSLAMNRERRLQMWSVVNVDYDADGRQWFPNRESFGSDKWIPDPRIPAELQIMDAEAYKPSPSLQRGHIVRRDDSAWGESKRGQEFANSDTFHWTNCTPQHGGFNESSFDVGPGETYEGLWGSLENKIARLIEEVGNRAVIMAGPVLNNEKDDAYDWGLGPVQIPMKYWKVLIVLEEDGLAAYGFVLDQTQAFEDLGFERLNLGKFTQYQVPLSAITTLTGVEFDQVVLDADVSTDGSDGFEIRPGAPIRRRGPRRRGRGVGGDRAPRPGRPYKAPSPYATGVETGTDSDGAI